MKPVKGTALAATVIAAAMALPITAPAAEQTEAPAATEAAELKRLNRERARKAQAEAAQTAADSVRSAIKLDLDIRLIGPTSIAGEF